MLHRNRNGRTYHKDIFCLARSPLIVRDLVLYWSTKPPPVFRLINHCFLEPVLEDFLNLGNRRVHHEAGQTGA